MLDGVAGTYQKACKKKWKSAQIWAGKRQKNSALGQGAVFNNCIEELGAGGNSFAAPRSRQACLRHSASARLAGFANVDSALEECAIFNGDARGHDITGRGPVTADIDTIARGQITANFSEHHDFACIDVRGNYAVASDCDAIAGKVDRTFDAAVDVKRLRPGHFTFNDKRFPDGSLIGSAGRQRVAERWRQFRLPQERWALKLEYAPARSATWRRGLICRLPHVKKNPSFWEMMFRAESGIRNPVSDFTLPQTAFVLWKSSIVCAFSGILRDFRAIP